MALLLLLQPRQRRRRRRYWHWRWRRSTGLRLRQQSQLNSEVLRHHGRHLQLDQVQTATITANPGTAIVATATATTVGIEGATRRGGGCRKLRVAAVGVALPVTTTPLARRGSWKVGQEELVRHSRRDMRRAKISGNAAAAAATAFWCFPPTVDAIVTAVASAAVIVAVTVVVSLVSPAAAAPATDSLFAMSASPATSLVVCGGAFWGVR